LLKFEQSRRDLKMLLSEKKIKEIFKKYKNSFEEMEHYDRTREKLWAKKRIDITLNQRTINKLKRLREQTGQPISQIIDNVISQM